MLPPRLQGSRYPGQDSEPRPIVPQLTEDSDGDDLGDVAYLRWPCCRYLIARLTSLCLETPPRVTWCPPVNHDGHKPGGVVRLYLLPEHVHDRGTDAGG